MISRLTLWYRTIIGPIRRLLRNVFSWLYIIAVSSYESSLDSWDHVVVVWRSDSALVSINRVNLRHARLVLGWWPCLGSISSAENLSLHVTIHRDTGHQPCHRPTVSVMQPVDDGRLVGVVEGALNRHVWIAGTAGCRYVLGRAMLTV